MPFRHATLIHKHATQQQRRLIPGISLVAATLVAVVLLLVTTTNLHAHDPGVEPDEASPCDGITSGQLSVGTLNSESRSFSSLDNECQFNVVVTSPSIQGEVPTNCQISYEPVATSAGLEVTFSMTGACDGVLVESEITMPPDSGVEEVTQAASTSSGKWALSKLIGHDLPHAIMFLHYSRVDWTYNGAEILSARQSVGRFTNDWWHTHSTRKHSFMNTLNTIFDAWDDVEWHSDGFPEDTFPDVRADSRVTTRVRAGGSHSCYHTFAWVSGAGSYPKLHKHTLCQSG
ncbi:MAG: hypothetical protein OXD50_04230 [Chloroflexi bacterium]|nr:hypothetical protein [Chloroflexota bacterium]